MDRRSWMLLWGLAAVWGGSYLLIKIALDSLEPMVIVAGRLLLGAAVLLAIAARRGALEPLRGRVLEVAVLGIFQVGAPLSLITFGELHVASGLTGILVAASPLFTVLLVLGGFGRADTVSSWAIGGVLLGLVGVGLLFGVDLTGSGDAILGGSLILLAGVGYAAGPLYVRRRFAGVPPVGMAAATMTSSAVVTLPFGLAGLGASSFDAGPVFAVVVLGVLGTGLAFYVMFTLIATVGAPRASMVAYLAPGFSVAYGALFNDEVITLAMIAGLVLILLGSWTAGQGRAPWRRAVPVAPATG